MIIFAIFSVIGILSNIFLPETLGIPPPDLIEEIKTEFNTEKEKKRPTTIQITLRVDSSTEKISKE